MNYLLLFLLIGDWGLGIGDWGLGIGDWGGGTVAKHETPIANHQSK